MYIPGADPCFEFEADCHSSSSALALTWRGAFYLLRLEPGPLSSYDRKVQEPSRVAAHEAEDFRWREFERLAESCFHRGIVPVGMQFPTQRAPVRAVHQSSSRSRRIAQIGGKPFICPTIPLSICGRILQHIRVVRNIGKHIVSRII